ncbi:MAG: DEAD/DEAH box helicase [Acidobacteriota bacterium]
MPTAPAEALSVFHPLIHRWFDEAVGEPTEIQQLAWPRIAAGEHVLISAPTGSGKTLTAFLWALHQLLTGQWTSGRVRVLYVSPLRALNTDIRRNLQRPLAELTERFSQAGKQAPGLRVMTRSGDTPPAERQKMLRRPPEILITTPESLNILLTSKGGRTLLTGLETVILDEIHAVTAGKRGTHLITAVDRLVPLSGEFQRVALSATIRPMTEVASFVGGWQLHETEGGVSYSQRRVARVRSSASKTYELRIRHPLGKGGLEVEEETLWQRLVEDLLKVIRRNRSTLLFANSRRMTEKVTRLINQEAGEELAYSHHGSLSREVRAVVEKRLKEGELKAIVATNSLELGIDIGALDEVILIQSPRAISSAIQRIGRAGHGVGEISRGVFYPTHGRDFLDAAIIARSIFEQDIESVLPVAAPLDVLAQVILSMVASEPWNVDDLHAVLRTSYPYRHLKRRQLDLVVDMLTGRYADSRIRDLRPRASFDRIDNTLEARRGVARILYMSGGTIADRGYFALRLEDSMAKLGELDEEFVWERSTGDTFTLGAQSWQIRRVTHNDVLVRPARRSSALAPFWRSDAQDRDFFFSQKIARFLGGIEERLDEPGLTAELGRDYRLEEAAAEELISFLAEQRAATGELPHLRRLLVETCDGGPSDDGRGAVILHTFWGGTVNRPLTIALQAAWEERYDEPFEVFHDDDCILLRLPRGFEATEVLELVDPEQLETLLRRRLEQTGFFGARFRVNASTALLLPRSGFRHRTPLWMHRQRSKKLLEAVSPYGDFPVLVETWRTCLQDEFDLDNLKQVLHRVEEGEIELRQVRTASPSPFAANLMWQHTNHYMYADDSPESTGGGVSNLRQDLLKELVFQSHLRPRLPAQLVEQFRAKVQRLSPGYAPHPGTDLIDWISERILIPEAEWRQLLAAVTRDHEVDAADTLQGIEHRVVRIDLAGTAVDGTVVDSTVVNSTVGDRPAGDRVVALEALPRLAQALDLDLDHVPLRTVDGAELPASVRDDLHRLLNAPPSTVGERGAEAADEEARWGVLTDWVGEWLRFHGPIELTDLGPCLGLGETAARTVLEMLQESQRVVLDQLVQGAETLQVCDAENLETLLRWLRTARRPSFETLPAAQLPLFLASHQGLVERGDSVEGLQDRLEKLFGYLAPAAVWETEILPARLDPYYPAWLDALMQESELIWLGCGQARLTFAFAADRELFFEPGAEAPPDAELVALFGERPLRADLTQLAERSGRTTGAISEALWPLAWAGKVSNDGYLAVRKGIETKFQPTELPTRGRGARPRSRRRGGAARWQASRPGFGHWFVVETTAPPQDALEAEELTKDRIRVLLQRYGVLFRELLVRELPPLQWSRVFRALRLMELSGEVLAGHFFAGVRGLQFASHTAFRALQRGLPQDAVYWLAAVDPASLAGVEVEGLKGTLPSRLPSNHLVYHGARLVVSSQRRGRELEVRCRPDHPRLRDYYAFLKVLMTRDVMPRSSIDIETINGEPAVGSPYCATLGEVFRLTREPRGVKLWKKY